MGDSFWAYYRLVSQQIARDVARHWVAALVTTVACTATTVLLEIAGIIPANQIWPRIAIGALVAFSVLTAYVLIAAAQAPWKIHNDVVQQHDASQEVILQKLQELGDKLLTEQARNSKPEITVSLDRAKFERVGIISTKTAGSSDEFSKIPAEPPFDISRVDDMESAKNMEDSQTLRVLVYVSFRNLRLQVASIDDCALTMEVGGVTIGGRRVFSLGASWSLDPNVTVPPESVGEMEPNVLIEYGPTVTRYAVFDLTQRRATGKQWPSDAAFEIIATDSFGEKHSVSRAASGLSGQHGDVTLS